MPRSICLDDSFANLTLATVEANREKGNRTPYEAFGADQERFADIIGRVKGFNGAFARISYSDYVIVRLLYEATRDAGFWNMHWTITNMPPNSDQVWKQWKTVHEVSPLKPTASAECDELSALYAFLVERAGTRSVGLFWPYSNHTVAVWVLHPANGAEVRVVVPTSQVFLGVNDSFGTRKFNPWHQKTIFEYTRRDVPDSFELPKPLFDCFVRQIERYAGASDSTLQEIRYLREGVFLKTWTAEAAAQDALERKRGLGTGPTEDRVAFENFAADMRETSSH